MTCGKVEPQNINIISKSRTEFNKNVRNSYEKFIKPCDISLANCGSVALNDKTRRLQNDNLNDKGSEANAKAETKTKL